LTSIKCIDKIIFIININKMKNIRITSSTGLYCIFGNPVRHSISPVMQNAAFTETGIDAVYLAFETSSIGEAVTAMKSIGIMGASVTIPFKIDVMKHLDVIDPLAASIGSVNTIVNDKGTLSGFNTDGYGAVLAIEQSGITLKGKTSLVIGNGGSARAIALTLVERGACVIIAGRNDIRVNALVQDLKTVAPDTEGVILKDLSPSYMEKIDVIINTTPIGMTPDIGSTPLDASLIAPHHIVFDIVYAPHETRFLADARKIGCGIVYGIEMLILQGARQFEIWTGREAPVGTMRRAAYHHLHIKT